MIAATLVDAGLGFGAGFGLGFLTGLPLGVVNLTIVEAAIAGEPRFARGAAFGGALADTLHAALAFLGVATLLATHPQLARWLAVGFVGLVGVHGLVTRRRRAASHPVAGGASLARGVATGLLLTATNPAALLAWSAMASALAGTAVLAMPGAMIAGVGAGSATCFSLIAGLASAHAGTPAARCLGAVARWALIAIAIVGLVKVW